MFCKKYLKPLAASAAIVAACASPVLAGDSTSNDNKLATKTQLLQEVGGAERINFSGKLRMLSQRIPAAACNLEAGVAPDQSAKILGAAAEEFNKIVNALEYGDPTLNIIGQEGRRRTLKAIADVRAEWEPIVAAARLAQAEGMTASLNQQLADQNDRLLGKAKLLVSELTGQYSDPAAVLQSDALRIDIAGRQRMLSQRISKDICYVLSGVNTEASKASLAKTISVFDVSHNALQFGQKDVGLKAPRHPEIIEGMKIVADHWAGLQPAFEKIEATGALSLEERAAVFSQLNNLLVDMNKVVGMFARESKQNI